MMRKQPNVRHKHMRRLTTAEKLEMALAAAMDPRLSMDDVRGTMRFLELCEEVPVQVAA